MLKIDRHSKTFIPLAKNTLAEAELTERYDFQCMIRQSSDAFFKEMGEELLLLGEEIRPTDFCDDRIDLLALDPSGAAVVIEIKRGSNRLQLLQSIAYAGMLSRWPTDRFINERARFLSKPPEEVRDEIKEFCSTGVDGVGQVQRVILLAEGFDYEVLIGAEWLYEKYDVDIRCYRVALSADGANEYISCSCVYPPAELAEHAEARRGSAARTGATAKTATWVDALKASTNTSLAAFFQGQLDAGQDNDVQYPALLYRMDGRARWYLTLRRTRGYAWQTGRFAEDIAFWRQRLSLPDEVKAVEDGRCLRFYLETSSDCDNFRKAVTQELAPSSFLPAGKAMPEMKKD